LSAPTQMGNQRFRNATEGVPYRINADYS
jgi:hypothetical protein